MVEGSGALTVKGEFLASNKQQFNLRYNSTQKQRRKNLVWELQGKNCKDGQ
jgi:hypothetical protein